MSASVQSAAPVPAAPASELERLRAELAAERRKGELSDECLAVVAHELRAPLGAILGWAHMLRRHGGYEELDRGLDVIEQSVQVQARLIEDLLVASRMSSNRIRLEPGPVDLAALVAAAVESVRPSAAEKDLALHQALEPVGELRGDPTRLQQVVCNLLTNAVKFTPAGGAIAVTLGRSRGWAVLGVKDTGVGITPGFLPRVFDRFQQDPSTGRAQGGLGLGLAIARHLVELHGGEISAASDGPGQGATFTVRLPLAEPAVASPRA